MNSRYEQMEDTLVALLQGNSNYKASPLPDNKDDFQHSAVCKVLVMYNNSTFEETDNLKHVNQREKIFIGVEFRCLTRRGNTGLFSAQKEVFKRLIGYKMPGCDPLSLVDFGPLQGSGPGNWDYFATFSTISRVSQVNPVINEPLLKTITFLEPEV